VFTNELDGAMPGSSFLGIYQTAGAVSGGVLDFRNLTVQGVVALK
jgi:hypothetical protein